MTTETTSRTVTFYRVDVAKATRNSLTLDPKRFKEEVIFSRAHLRNKDWRKQMGALGLIEKSDFEQGAYAEYGLKPDRIEGITKVQNLESTNTELQKKIAELEAQIASKKTTPKAKKETPKEETEEAPLNESIETPTETNTTV